MGAAVVRPHRESVIDDSWQFCETDSCHVVYYLAEDTIDDETVVTQVGRKATHRATPVCFCFSHTAEALVSDAETHGGSSTIKASIRQAVANGHCACAQLNPHGSCCLPDIHRALRSSMANTGPGPV